jgi:hypothetical protein
MLPGIPGHDAKRPVVSAGGAKPEPCGPPPGVMTGTPDNGEITVVLGGTGATPEDCIIGDGAGTGTLITVGNGLTPPGASSLEPIGIPTRPTLAVAPIALGEDWEAAGSDEDAPPALAHPPEAVPEVRASNNAAGVDMPCVIDKLAAPPQPELLPLIVPGT